MEGCIFLASIFCDHVLNLLMQSEIPHWSIKLFAHEEAVYADLMWQLVNNYFNRALSMLNQRGLTAPQLKQIQSHLVVSGAIGEPLVVGELGSRFAITDLAYAEALLSLPPARSVSNWNTVVRALSENGQPENVFLLGKKMVNSNILPDNYTLSFIFRAGAELSNVVLMLMYHSLVIRLGWDLHDFVLNGLIHCYASCKSMEFARKLFDTSYNRDVVAWTAVINGYLKIGEVVLARELFNEMPKKNAVSWSSMINGYARLGMLTEVLVTFNDMLRVGIRPTHSAMVGALSACSHLGALFQGCWIHAYIDRSNMELDTVLGTALIDMYAKCGCVNMACDVFGKMPYCDVFAYTSLILGLADLGESSRVLQLFRRMELEEVHPNKVTFICVLSACSRLGLVEEGLRIFKSMTEDYGILPQPQHYGCLVDLLGRAGLLEPADKVVRSMATKPDSFALGALLNACRVHGNLNLEKLIFDGSNESYTDHSGVQVLVSNIYASLNKWDDVQRVRKGMQERNVKKVTGCSSLEVDGKVFEFISGDSLDNYMDETVSTAQRIHEHFR